MERLWPRDFDSEIERARTKGFITDLQVRAMAITGTGGSPVRRLRHVAG
jgi:hypothetical protein